MMNKRLHIILTSTLALASALTAHAQIFVLDNEQNLRAGTETEFGIIPENSLTIDQANEPYTPIGEGLLIMTALGGVYLINKKKREN